MAAGFESDRLRYPVLLVFGKSRVGKTEWACSLFKEPLLVKLGTLKHLPTATKSLDRARHDGLVLDLRDLQWLAGRQNKLQGKYSSLVELGDAPSGQYACKVDLFCLPTCTSSVYATGLQSLRTCSCLPPAAFRELCLLHGSCPVTLQLHSHRPLLQHFDFFFARPNLRVHTKVPAAKLFGLLMAPRPQQPSL